VPETSNVTAAPAASNVKRSSIVARDAAWVGLPGGPHDSTLPGSRRSSNRGGLRSTSAIFSVVNGVLLRPLPYPDPEGLVRVHELVPQYGRFSVAPGTFLDWRRQNAHF